MRSFRMRANGTAIPGAMDRFWRLATVVAVAGLGAGCGPKVTAHTDPAQRTSHATPTPTARTTATPAPIRLHVTGRGHLPAPVQLPAMTAAGRSALAMGGLSSADTSLTDIVRIDGATGRLVGHLPSPLHDAAAATVDGRTLFIGGGQSEAGSAAIDRVTRGGAVSAAGRLPAGASDVEAATVGGTAYVVGGYTGT